MQNNTPQRTIHIDSRTLQVECNIVSCNRISQTSDQIRNKTFTFDEIIPYDLDPLQNTCFIELIFVETFNIRIREILQVYEDSVLVKTTRGIVKKYNRGVHMISINGKAISNRVNRRRLFLKKRTPYYL